HDRHLLAVAGGQLGRGIDVDRLQPEAVPPPLSREAPPGVLAQVAAPARVQDYVKAAERGNGLTAQPFPQKAERHRRLPIASRRLSAFGKNVGHVSNVPGQTGTLETCPTFLP